MAYGILLSIRTSRADQINDAVNAGAGAGKLRFYDGTRPATGGAVTTLGAELTFSDPAFVSAIGVLTADPITGGTAVATVTLSWFRIVDSDDTFVMDGDLGLVASGAEIELNTLDCVIGLDVNVSSLVITEGNP